MGGRDFKTNRPFIRSQTVSRLKQLVEAEAQSRQRYRKEAHNPSGRLSLSTMRPFTPAMSTQAHPYTPLKLADIRLITIENDSKEISIKCHMIKTQQQLPPYYALSYIWGDPLSEERCSSRWTLVPDYGKPICCACEITNQQPGSNILLGRRYLYQSV
jgi:hypothetical protein